MEELTQANFDQLPLLVRTGTFVRWSGLRRDQVIEMISRGELKAVITTHDHRKSYRFPKAELARLCGFKW